MYFNCKDLSELEKGYKIKFINSLSGYKGVHLLGTKGENGVLNVGIFTSVVHISSAPPTIGILFRPQTSNHQSLANILSQKEFTLNTVNKELTDQAHYTSANFDENSSEFDKCALTPLFFKNFKAPFVKEAPLKIGLKYISKETLSFNNMTLLLGEINHVEIDEKAVEESGQIDFSTLDAIVATGLNKYGTSEAFKSLPYARVEDLPKFSKKSDQVVFDQKNKRYNASLLPYGTNIGAPSINLVNDNKWKGTSLHKFNQSINSKVNRVKEEYLEIVEEYKRNELIYNAKISFEPIIGELYHLYKNKSGEDFLSIITPDTWNKEYLGSFVLNHDRVWEAKN